MAADCARGLVVERFITEETCVNSLKGWQTESESEINGEVRTHR